MRDGGARLLAAAALAVALIALALAGWALSLGQRYLDDVQTLGDVLRAREMGGTGPAAPGLGPPPALDTEIE